METAILRQLNICPPKDFYVNFYGSLTDTDPKLEPTKMSISKGMDEQDTVYSCIGILENKGTGDKTNIQMNVKNMQLKQRNWTFKTNLW